MLQVRGNCNTAKIFNDHLEEGAEEQIRLLCDQAFAAGSQIRIMPDVHAGKGCTIGTTMTITDKVVPNLVGVDIGCGMETVRLAEETLDLEALDQVIRQRIPAGFSIRQTLHPYNEAIDLTALRCAKRVNLGRARRSIGTLGGGNHFIEVDKDEDGALYLIVHSGSRHLGLEVAGYYQEQGYQQLNGSDEIHIQQLIEAYKAAGREKELEPMLKKLKKERRTAVPKTLAYVSGPLFDDYLHDMALVQRFALINRQAMVDEILAAMGLTAVERFTTIHNYIDLESMILRKGAVSARQGQKLLIPINMRDGSLICRGLGNPDWNHSAPHGAGRLMSRTKARKAFSVAQFQDAMAGIYTTSVNRDTLDECPMAYKDMSAIVDNIGPTAEIKKIIRPIYNFKAGER